MNQSDTSFDGRRRVGTGHVGHHLFDHVSTDQVWVIGKSVDDVQGLFHERNPTVVAVHKAWGRELTVMFKNLFC